MATEQGREREGPMWLSKWPEWFRVIGHPIRYAALAAVFFSARFSNPEKQGALRFSQIKKALAPLKPTDSVINYHLRRLRKARFLRRGFVRDGEDLFKVYRITNQARDFLSASGLVELWQREYSRSD